MENGRHGVKPLLGIFFEDTRGTTPEHARPLYRARATELILSQEDKRFLYMQKATCNLQADVVASLKACRYALPGRPQAPARQLARLIGVPP
ncbi:hypothetical protein LMG27177_07589 [Paraburkholderia fynbosensis]|uniref:Uncharacterized protein n=1 Tax=Paraburkholderia fynbosensis TaxID=1200993 RepID=A0A6J5H1U3_9BURK|nr:hypothetical protein LMG27177_07589 [Paraburkholderia fynbosensis]